MHSLVSNLSFFTKIIAASCLIRTFLQAEKHVCVEYPVTLSYRAAVELWDLAQEKGDTNL